MNDFSRLNTVKFTVAVEMEDKTQNDSVVSVTIDPFGHYLQTDLSVNSKTRKQNKNTCRLNSQWPFSNPPRQALSRNLKSFNPN